MKNNIQKACFFLWISAQLDLPVQPNKNSVLQTDKGGHL